MAKYYFKGDEDEQCWTLDTIKDDMKTEGITELEVFEAKMLTGQGVFYCSYHGEPGESGEGCGKECHAYKPRNGKSGRCVHHKNCYYGDKKVTIKL